MDTKNTLGNIFVFIYKIYVLSAITYGREILMIASQKNPDKFETIQNQALRILIGKVTPISLDAMLST